VESSGCHRILLEARLALTTARPLTWPKWREALLRRLLWRCLQLRREAHAAHVEVTAHVEVVTAHVEVRLPGGLGGTLVSQHHRDSQVSCGILHPESSSRQHHPYPARLLVPPRDQAARASSLNRANPQQSRTRIPDRGSHPMKAQ